MCQVTLPSLSLSLRTLLVEREKIQIQQAYTEKGLCSLAHGTAECRGNLRGHLCFPPCWLLWAFERGPLPIGFLALCLADCATDLLGEQHAVYVLGVLTVPWGMEQEKRKSPHSAEIRGTARPMEAQLEHQSARPDRCSKGSLEEVAAELHFEGKGVA